MLAFALRSKRRTPFSGNLNNGGQHGSANRQLPVVDGSVLLGIVTDRDLRSFLAGPSLLDPAERAKALRTPVREIMTNEPLTLGPEDDLRDAVELLIDEKVGGIPVVDQTEGLVGIVTYVDVLRCFLNRLDEQD